MSVSVTIVTYESRNKVHHGRIPSKPQIMVYWWCEDYLPEDCVCLNRLREFLDLENILELGPYNS